MFSYTIQRNSAGRSRNRKYCWDAVVAAMIGDCRVGIVKGTKSSFKSLYKWKEEEKSLRVIERRKFQDIETWYGEGFAKAKGR